MDRGFFPLLLEVFVIFAEEEAVGPAFGSGFVCFEWLCVGLCVSWSLLHQCPEPLVVS